MAALTAADVLDCLQALGKIKIEDIPATSLPGFLTHLLNAAVTHLASRLDGLAFARCLIGKGDGSLDYHHTPLIWNPAIAVCDACHQAAAFKAYITVSELLRDAKIGGGITRRLLWEGKDPGYYDVVSEGSAGLNRVSLAACNFTFSEPELSGHFSQIISQFTHNCRRHVQGCSQADMAFLAAVDGDGAAVPAVSVPERETLVANLRRHVDADDPAHGKNSFGLMKLWFAQGGICRFLVYHVPFPSGEFKWGGAYFVFLRDPDSGDIDGQFKFNLAFLVREVFLQCHWRWLVTTEEENRTLRLHDRIAGLAKRLASELQPVIRTARELRSAFLPPGSVFLEKCEEVGRLIPDGGKANADGFATYFQRWRFYHRWTLDLMKAQPDSFRAHFACLLLTFWEIIEPPSQEDPWPPGKEMPWLSLAGVLDERQNQIARWGPAMAGTARAVAGPPELSLSSSDVTSYRILKGSFFNPFKSRKPLTGPLLATWCVSLDGEIENHDLLYSENSAAGTTWPTYEILENLQSLVIESRATQPQSGILVRPVEGQRGYDRECVSVHVMISNAHHDYLKSVDESARSYLVANRDSFVDRRGSLTGNVHSIIQAGGTIEVDLSAGSVKVTLAT